MRRGDTTRERLLTETTRLVHRAGFARTSVNTVLKAAGIKKGALYHHFPGKDKLGLAVLTRASTGFLAFIDAALIAPTPLEGLDRFFTAALQAHRDMGFVGGCLWGNTALEMSDSSHVHTEIVARVFEEWISRMARVIHAGQEAGQIRTDLPASDLACLVVAAIEGGIMQSRLRKQEGPLRSCLTALRAMLAQGSCCGISSSGSEGNK